MDLKLGKSAGLAAVFTAAILAIGFLFQKLFAQSINALFAISYPANIPLPVSPVSTTIGGKIAAIILQYIPGNITIPNVGLLFISAFVAILIGNFIVSNLKAPVANGKVGKIASLLLYGTIPLYLIVVGMVMPSMNTTIGVLLYTVVAAYVAAFFADLLKISID